MPRTDRRRAPAWMSLAVLAFAAWQGVTTLAGTPALNATLRVKMPEGGTRPLLAHTMYDRAEYLYQAAYGHAHFVVTALQRGAGASSITPKVIARQMTLTRQYAGASLERAPANAHAWSLLATSLRADGQMAAAEDAYLNSARLAPYSAALFLQRLRFADGSEAEFLSRPEVEAAIENDIRVLAQFAPRALGYAKERFPKATARVLAERESRRPE